MPEIQKTLVVLTPGFPDGEEDTTCLPERQTLMRELKRAFPAMHFIVLSFHYPYKSTTYQWHGIDVISFNGRNRGKLERLRTWYRVFRRLNRIRGEQELVGLLSFWQGECGFFGSVYARTYGLKHYCWILGQDARPRNRYFKLARSSSQSLVALSDALSEEVQKNYGIKPAHTIPPGIDPLLFSATAEVRDIDILGVGSLIPLKQYDLFVSVVQSTAARRPGLKALLCGKGPERENLQHLIREGGLVNSLQLVEERPYPEVLQLMQRAKVLVHTSSYEGWSSVCMEALAAGAHVVSFCRPMRQEIPHLHIVTNEEEMVEKIIELLLDPDPSHEPIVPFPIQHSARQLMSLYTG
jgi:glycosyltransferase involved in cell wall biosynthesis